MFGGDGRTNVDVGGFTCSPLVLIPDSMHCSLRIIFSLLVLGLTAPLNAAWNVATRDGDIVYFFDLSAKLQRYDLTTQSWLESRDLNDVPTAGWVDGEEVFVAYDKAVNQFSLLQPEETHLRNFTYPVDSLFTDGNLLLIDYSSSLYARFASLDKTTGALLDETENYVHSANGGSIAPEINAIFGRTTGVSPSDITKTTYQDDGQFVSTMDSPHHGDYPGATRTWVFPDAKRVVDNSGTVYAASTLNYVGSFGQSFVDVAFYGDELPVFITESRVVGLNAGLLPTGYIDLDFIPGEIQVYGETIFLFTADATQATGIRMIQYPISELALPEPGEPIDPTTVQIDPDLIFVDRDGVVNLFSRQLFSLFRWDPTRFTWLMTKPLPSDPLYVAYDAAHHALFCGDSSGLITRLDLSEERPQAIPFANLPTTPRGMAVAGEFLFTVDSSGAWVTHRVFDLETGNETDSSDWAYSSKAFYWDETRRRLYFYRDDTSPNDILYREVSMAGKLGEQVDSIYHGDYSFVHPMRFFPDRSRILTGAGVVFNASNLNYNATLTNAIYDAAWLEGTLFTLRRDSTGWSASDPTSTTLQRWGPSLGLQDDTVVAGTPQALLSLDGELIAIVSYEGALRFLAFDADLQLLAVSDLGGQDGPVGIDWVADAYEATWDPATFDPADVLVVESLDVATGDWESIGEVDAATGAFVLEGTQPGELYDFRFKIKERTSTVPLPTVPTLSHRYTVSWEYPPSPVIFTAYVRRDTDASWIPEAEFSSSARSWSADAIETFAAPEIELRYAAEEISVLPPGTVKEGAMVHFNWLRSQYDDNGYKLAYLNPQGEPVVISSYGKDVFNVSFPRESLAVDLDRYRLYVVNGERLVSHSLQISVDLQLEWTDSAAPPEAYRVEYNAYGTVWSTLAEYANDASAVTMKFVSVNDYPVLRVTRLEGHETRVHTTGLSQSMWTSLSWPSGTFSGLLPALEWRDTPDGEWTLDPQFPSTYATSASRNYEGNVAREYRLAQRQTVPERVAGYATLQVPPEIDLATYRVDDWNMKSDAEGWHLEMKTERGLTYTLERSANLQTWTPVDAPFAGTGRIEDWDVEAESDGTVFYRFRLEAQK